MKDSIILFLFLIPTFLFAQYPTTGNKSRLGWQTTGDGLIWRGVSGDTVNKPNNRNYPYFQLDTVNSVLYRYIATQGSWQSVGGGSIDIDSLVYATRFWVNSNFFPLQGGTLTGTGGNGFVGFPVQSSTPATPSTGFSLYAGSTGNNISWMQPDGFFRRLVSPVTGTPRQYQFMARSYTLGDSADIVNNVTSIAANYVATSNGTNLVARNLFDNNTYVGILNNKPWQFGQWTTAGRPAGTTGYTGYNTTTAFTEGYFTSQWENYITSTGASNTQVPVFSSAGKIAGSNQLVFTTGFSSRIAVDNTSFHNSGLLIKTTGTNRWSTAAYQAGSGNIDFTFYNEQTDNSSLFIDGSTNNVAIGNNTSPQRTLHVAGEARITDLTTDTPTRIVGADADGDLGAVTWLFPLSPGSLGIGASPTYALDVTSSTNALGLPRGTVAQRPTIASSTTPFRYNTDSTALEYGESVGTWRQLATRAYARTLAATATWLKPELEAGRDVTITGTSTVDLSIKTDSTTLESNLIIAKTPEIQINTTGIPTMNGRGQDATFGGVLDMHHRDSTSYTYMLFNETQSGIPQGTSFWSRSGGSFRQLLTIGRTALTLGHTQSNMDVTRNVTIITNRTGTGEGTIIQKVNKSTSSGNVLTLKNDTDTTSAQVFSNILEVNQNGTTTINSYGTNTKTAAALSKTFSTLSGFATDGTVLNVEQKRDTTIYVTDADYNFSAAITSANILLKFNRIIIYSKLSASSTSDNQIFLHTPSSDFLQCEIIIYSNDASADSDATSIDFTTNGAVDGAGGTLSSYAMAPGQRVEIRVADDGGYKWFFN